jgi:hypothetical protein
MRDSATSVQVERRFDRADHSPRVVRDLQYESPRFRLGRTDADSLRCLRRPDNGGAQTLKEPAMAALLRNNQIIPLCIGCTTMLEFCGMLTRLSERELNPRQPDFLFAVYEIKPPYTLEDCQKIVNDRHKGNAGEKWGEMP